MKTNLIKTFTQWVPGTSAYNDRKYVAGRNKEIPTETDSKPTRGLALDVHQNQAHSAKKLGERVLKKIQKMTRFFSPSEKGGYSLDDINELRGVYGTYTPKRGAFEICPISKGDNKPPIPEYSAKQKLLRAMQVKTGMDPLGHGKHGDVYESTPKDRNPRRRMEVLKTTLNTSGSKELEIVKQLSQQPHPNIASAVAGYRSDGKVQSPHKDIGYLEGIVMEFEGQTLKELLDPTNKLAGKNQLPGKPVMKGGLPDKLLRSVAGGVAKALNHLHNVATPPITHQDLNPGNILITGSGEAKLTDFGIARYLNQDIDKVSVSVQFAAPEVMNAISIEKNSDMWSFGCLLFEAATGERLCESDKPLKIDNKDEKLQFYRELIDHALNHKDLQSTYHAQLKDLLSKLLVIDPEERLDSSETLEHPYFKT